MSSFLRLAPLVLASSLAAACAEEEPEPIPLEDSYTWTIQSGRVCAPATAHTGSDDDIPIRYEMCVYRCLGASGPSSHSWAWNCESGNCRFEVVPNWEMEPVVNEKGCDARDLVEPPEGECNDMSFDYNLSPPKDSMGDYVEKTFEVKVPYLDADQAATFRASLDDGAGFSEALDTALGGLQVIPERAFDMELSTSAPVLTHDDLTDADCHDIPVRDFAG
jgi:hypothetical protein